MQITIEELTLNDPVASLLQKRAKEHNRSPKEELKELVASSLATSKNSLVNQANQLREHLDAEYHDSTAIIRESRLHDSSNLLSLSETLRNMQQEQLKEREGQLFSDSSALIRESRDDG